MAVLRRLFGFNNDPNSAMGGTNLEALAPPIADVTKFWPAHSANVAWNDVKINRNMEVRGRRAANPEIPFSMRPLVTATLPAYRSIAAKVLKCAMGVEGAIVGAAPGPYTHPLTALGYGSSQFLPTLNLQVIRDALNHKATGCAVESATLTFPIGGEGTLEITANALYMQQVPASVPTSGHRARSRDAPPPAVEAVSPAGTGC